MNNEEIKEGEGSAVASVSERLGERESVPEVRETMTAVPPIKAPEAAPEPAPAFDITKLSPEQMVALKAALENTPLRIVKKGKPVIKLRRMNGRIIVDFGNCFQALHTDKVTNISSEIVMIPVKFMDANGKPEKEFTNVSYRDFMNADQIKCEVESQRTVPGRYVEGEVESNERPGIMVELEVKTIETFFIVKLPEGSPVPTLEVEGRLANA